MKKFLAVLCALTLLLGSLTMFSHADFGGFAGDSDYGDYGGYDYDYDNDYDYDYDDDDDDYDYNYGGFYSGDGSGGSSDFGEGDNSVLGGIIVASIIIYIVLKRTGLLAKMKKSKKTPVRAGGATPTPKSSLQDMSKYNTLDPNFSASAFCEKVSNLYVQFQNAWTAKDLTPLRPYLTDAMYAMCDRQLNAYRMNKQTNHVDRIAVLDVRLEGFKQQSGMDTIVVRLKTRIVDYTLSDSDGRLVRGDQNKEKFMEYEWNLVRKSGTVTAETSGLQASSCPHCGAPIEINQSAVCEYCGSVLKSDPFDWAVHEIKGIAQRTAD